MPPHNYYERDESFDALRNDPFSRYMRKRQRLDHGEADDDDDDEDEDDNDIDYDDLIEFDDLDADDDTADGPKATSAVSLTDAELDALEAKDAALRAQWQSWRPPVAVTSNDAGLYASYREDSYDVLTNGRGPRLILYGNTQHGNSIAVKITGRNHAFYVQMPRAWSQPQYDDFYEALAAKTRNAVLYALGNKHLSNLKPEHRALVDECFGGEIFRSGTWFNTPHLKAKDVDSRNNVLSGYTIEYHKAGKEYVDKRDDTPRAFMCIQTRYPCVVNKAKAKIDMCLGGKSFSGVEMDAWLPESCRFGGADDVDKPCTFEAAVKFQQYLPERLDLHPVQWFRMPPGTYRLTPDHERVSECQLEVEIDWRDVVPYSRLTSTQKKKLAVPDTTGFSFDIETELGPYSEKLRKYTFGSPQNQRCLIIGQHVYSAADKSKERKVHFGLGSVNPIKGSECYTWDYTEEGERRMLLAWRRFVLHVDPDSFDSYNGENFDFYFLLERARALGIGKRFAMFGRSCVSRDAVSSREMVFKNRGRGTQQNRMTTCVGRSHFDMYRVIRNEYTVRDKTLNAVARYFLKESKHELDIQKLPEMMKTLEGRTELALYCLQDCALPRKLKAKLGKEAEYAALAELADCLISEIVNRGQMCRVYRLLRRWMHARGYLMPDEMSGRKVDYEGAHVKQQRAGLYMSIVLTLDFSSLYPSIIMMANLCYTTVLSESTIRAENLRRGEWFDFEKQCIKPEYLPLESERDPASGKVDFLRYVERIKQIEERDGIDYYVAMDFEESGDGRDYVFRYVPGKKSSPFCAFRRRMGILPLAEIDTLNLREEAKALRDTIEDKSSLEYAVLDGRQIGCKLLGNSGYGYTSGMLMPDSRISYATTHIGQGMIRFAQYKEQLLITKANGFPCDLWTIAGDTDSTMNWLPGVTTDEDAVRIGRAVEKAAQEWFLPPHVYAFEKYSYRSIFLPVKKRYAMYIITVGKTKPEMKITGLESKRRDNFPLLPEVMDRFLASVLIDNNLTRALHEIRNAVRDLVSMRVRYNKLIIWRKFSKALDEYKNPDNLPHISLVKRMTQRDPDNAPRAGDMLCYIMREPMHKDEKPSSRTEDPLFAFDNGIPLDMEYYVKNLEEPMRRILLVCGLSEAQCTELFHGEHTRKRMRPNDEMPLSVRQTLVHEQEERLDAQNAAKRAKIGAVRKACGVTRSVKPKFQRLSESAANDHRQRSLFSTSNAWSGAKTQKLPTHGATAPPKVKKPPPLAVAEAEACDDIEDAAKLKKRAQPATEIKNTGPPAKRQAVLAVMHVRYCATCKVKMPDRGDVPLCTRCAENATVRDDYVREQFNRYVCDVYEPLRKQMKTCAECKGIECSWKEDISCIDKSCDGFWVRRQGFGTMRAMQKLVGTVDRTMYQQIFCV